jgi:hypothetical protein
MPIFLYPKCHRGRNDCEAIHCITSTPEDMPQEDLETLNFEPDSFVCSGLVNEADRVIPQDAYRLCFKNDATDQITDNDIQDLTHLMAVASMAMAMDSSMKIGSGKVEVPTEQSKQEQE